MKLPGIDPEQIEREYQNAKVQARARERARSRWYRERDLAKLKVEAKRASNMEVKVQRALTKTMPTTAAGAAALIEWAVADMEGGPRHGQTRALRDAAMALKRMNAAA
jgi:hypothetical protein